MAANQDTDKDRWLGVISRSLAYLCLHYAELGNKDLTTKSAFLQGLGLTRGECAKMLNTTDETLRVLEQRSKQSRKGKRGGQRTKNLPK